MGQDNVIKVMLFRAIDETSTVIIGNQIAAALDQLQIPEIEHQLYSIRRLSLPFDFQFKLVNRRITSSALNTYFARLIHYPLAARRKKADVYHITDDYYGSIIRVLPPERCIVTFNHETPALSHDIETVKPGPHLRIQRFIFSGICKAAYVLTSSKFIRDHLLDIYALDPDKVILNPYGHSPMFHPRNDAERLKTRKLHNLDPKWFVLLHVGNCGPRKNLEAILRSLSKLPDDIHFLQVGCGVWQPSQQALIDDLRLSSRVHRVTLPSFNTQFAKIYNAADLFVFPSLLEGFGLPIVEAMASGLPVVTSNFGAMAEVGGGSAELVDPHDPIQLAATIRILYQSPSHRERLKAAGLKRVKDFSWQKHAKTLSMLYKEVYTRTRET